MVRGTPTENMSILANGLARGYSYIAFIPLGVGNLKGALVERQKQLSEAAAGELQPITTPRPMVEMPRDPAEKPKRASAWARETPAHLGKLNAVLY